MYIQGVHFIPAPMYIRRDPDQPPLLTRTPMIDLESSSTEPDHDGNISHTPIANTPKPTFPPLKPSNTSQSAREAAKALSSFATSPENPHNWPNSQRWRIALAVALTGFISTSGSSIAVPGFHEILQEFGVDNAKVGVLVTSIYVLGMGTGPFIFAPLSELYGRQPAYLVSQVLMVLFCLGTALAKDMRTLIVLRFFAGMWSSVGPGLGVATCADMFRPDERGRPISIYAIGPMTGPVLGSMLGYWILFGGWRWLFYALTIMAAVNFVVLFSLTQETYAPVLEKKLKYRISHPISDATTWKQKISPSRIVHNLGWMSAMVSVDEARQVFGRAFSRPPRLLFTNPVCFLFSAYYSYIYGIIYLCLVTIPLLFGSPPFNRPELFSYQWPRGTLSLSYVGLGAGSLSAAAIAALFQDRIYKRLSRRKGDQGQPEYRLVLTQIGMIVCPIGMFILGWTAEAQTHWIGPQIGTTILLLGLTLAFNSIQNFIVDAFMPYSAAGTAAATALRSVLACILPIFAPDMFSALGWGWGCTLLALVALIAVPAPVVMFVWGKRLRERFQFHG